LRPGGRGLIQAIVIADQEYERAKSEVDFIRRYIFPGGCLPSVTAICQSLTRTTRLRLTGLEDLTRHYVTTLERWRKNLVAARESVKAMGHSEAFLRRWEYYFCYCEGGFAERAIGLVHLELSQPQLLYAPMPCGMIEGGVATPGGMIHHVPG
jgi:cyclopropane-fatty-acyl-phospholipid synthase